ncbi:MAG TPA: pyruvate kinase [Phycisphaerales bacterium]|nr:pyruvate kinase [Phycisphaerales bacterium]
MISGAGESTAARPPLTKILATIGPASSGQDITARLIEAGVSIFRLNFSHGTLDDHLSQVRTIRKAAGVIGNPIAILGDLQGPKIRVGKVAGEGIEVQPGAIVRFERGDIVGALADNIVRLGCTYRNLIDDVESGQRLLINDGAIRMLVVEKGRDSIECRVVQGGTITSNKGINLPDSHVRAASMSPRDEQCVRWALDQELDFLALSFVRTAEDVRLLAAAVDRAKSECGRPDLRISLIAKIETPQAVENIEPIVDAADGIMVARGDLGVEMDLAAVPIIQKRLLNVANDYGKPAIVATQMLESMINAPSPTRAEASDVATAILEGTDAVMLSGETAVGKHPSLAVEFMRRIAQRTEEFVAAQPQQQSPPRKLVESRYRTAALAHGVWTVSQDLAAKFIIVWSQQGGGARYLSQNNFCIPIIACTSDDRAARRMQLLRGVTPVRMHTPESPAHFTQMADEYLLKTGWASKGDVCIIVASGQLGVQGATNSLAIHAVGDPTTGLAARP